MLIRVPGRRSESARSLADRIMRDLAENQWGFTSETERPSEPRAGRRHASSRRGRHRGRAGARRGAMRPATCGKSPTASRPGTSARAERRPPRTARSVGGRLANDGGDLRVSAAANSDALPQRPSPLREIEATSRRALHSSATRRTSNASWPTRGRPKNQAALSVRRPPQSTSPAPRGSTTSAARPAARADSTSAVDAAASDDRARRAAAPNRPAGTQPRGW